jgi:serine/tyrosine/threonine adenylyltransferase
MKRMTRFRPSTAHAALGSAFFDVVHAADFPMAIPRFHNQRWAERVGLGHLTPHEWEAHFCRFEPLPGSFQAPLALRYHGHQFRVYNPEIGDGRGFLFAQLHDDQGRLLDLGTKGSGQTPYSRAGDGRLTLRGGVREVLATALLEAQGVYTSKTFSLFETGEKLMRGDEPSPTRSAVLVRLSHSHIRFGTFQRLASEGDKDALARLVAHCVRHYMPEAARPESAAETLAFFDSVVANIARMAAQWMAAGFVHGVLNTDNTVVTGESFDYGPWRWLPRHNPDFTAAYFDGQGIYAYGRQPHALKWNLARLAECLLPFVAQAELEAALEAYDRAFHAAMGEAVLTRLGLARVSAEASATLAAALFAFLNDSAAPFEQVFFDWHGGAARATKALSGPAAHLYRGAAFDAFRSALDAHAPSPSASLDHAYFAGDAPVTMLNDEMEALWAPIHENDDWALYETKLNAIAGMRAAYGVA